MAEADGADFSTVIRAAGRDLAREALEEASRRARSALVARLTESLIEAAERALAEPGRGPGGARAGAERRAPERQAPERAAEPTLWYVLAIGRAGAAVPPPVPGLDGEAPLLRLDRGPLTAVVCEVASDLFEGLAEEAVGPDGRLADLALRHDEAVRALFEREAILPLRFGTVLPSRAAVEAVLERGRERFAAELARVDGRAEWTCRLRLDEEPARPEPASPAAGPGGARYLAQRDAALRRDEDAGLGLRRAAEGLADAVQPLVAGSAVLSSAPGEIRTAHLVGMEQADGFAAAVEAWRAQTGAGGIEIEVSGPLPPYHFVDVQFEADAP